MQADFWHRKWAKNEIGFHGKHPNMKLISHHASLATTPGDCIFLPLCGKTLDIGWLLSRGYRVVGVELSEIAIEQLFEDLDTTPVISEQAGFRRYSADFIDIFVGDVFGITGDLLGTVHAIYDRAALVALPEEMRQRYARHLIHVTKKAPQLLLSFDYDQTVMPGPPFSVSEDEINRHYASTYTVQLLERTSIEGGLKGKCPATESAWLLS